MNELRESILIHNIHFYLRIWNLKENKLIKITELEKQIRSCSFSKDESSLACGLIDGTLVVLKTG